MSTVFAVIALLVALMMQVVAVFSACRYRKRGETSYRLAAAMTGAMLTSAAGLRVTFAQLGLDLDQHAALLWVWVAATAVLVGLAAAIESRRMPTVELAISVFVIIEAAAVYVLLVAPGQGIAGAPLRALLLAPAALSLAAYFGASVGYLLWSSGRLDVRIGYEGLVGGRYLLSKSSSVLSTVTTISVIGVALGVWLVIVSLGVLSGFENDLQRKIIGAGAHLVLKPIRGTTIDLDEDMIETIAGVQGVVAAAPYLEGEVAMASQSNYTGGMLFGIDPESTPAVLSVLGQINKGSLTPLIDEMRPTPPRPAHDPEMEFLPPAPVPHIVIGREMAKILNVGVGDRVRVISPILETMTPVGQAPRTLDFSVAGIFSIEMYEYDARYAYVSLKAARRFFETDARAISGVQIRTSDPERSDITGQAVLAALPSPGNDNSRFEALDWKRRNRTLFAALKLERVVALVVLVFIILVASFSIVNTLTMSVIEKRKEIAILMTMGARRVGIMKLFLVQGMLVGTFGTIIGAAGAILT
ncbi:MAG: ABC transporter permease, partial [Myxococcota bacterium]